MGEPGKLTRPLIEQRLIHGSDSLEVPGRKKIYCARTAGDTYNKRVGIRVAERSGSRLRVARSHQMGKLVTRISSVSQGAAVRKDSLAERSFLSLLLLLSSWKRRVERDS